jgi:hypothetical protein
MDVKYHDDRIPVSFRLDRKLVKRMKDVCGVRSWPPPPSQTEIVARGIELVLAELESKRGKRAQI